MIIITRLEEVIQDLYAKAIETLTNVSLEPVERNYLTNGSIFCLHQPARRPTLRPRRHTFLLARSNQNSTDDPVSR